MKFWSMIEEEQQPEILNVFIYGAIRGDKGFFGKKSDVIATQFMEDLKAHPDAAEIRVHINSPGGEVYAALGITNQLRKHPAVVSTYVDGIAASAATIIMQAANVGHRFMSTGTAIMVHDPSTSAQGNISILEKAIQVLGKVRASMLALYQETTGLDYNYLDNMMKDETWLTAAEAKELGFVDEIVTLSAPVVAEADNGYVINDIVFDFDDFAEPEKMKLKLQEIGITNKIGGHEMNAEQILASLSEEQRSTLEVHFAAQTAEPQESQEHEDTITASMSAEAKASYEAAQQKVAELEAQLAVSKEAAEYEEFKATLGDLSFLPLSEDHIKAFQMINKMAPEAFETLKPLLKVASAAVEAQTTGTKVAKDTTDANAFEQLESIAAKLRDEDSNLDYNESFKMAVEKNPELWSQYRAGI